MALESVGRGRHVRALIARILPAYVWGGHVVSLPIYIAKLANFDI